MMSLWAPHATLSIGSDLDRVRDGRDPASVPRGNALVRAHDSLDLGPPGLQGPDHGQRRPRHAALSRYVDAATGEVVLTTADMDVARIDGQWLITNMWLDRPS